MDEVEALHHAVEEAELRRRHQQQQGGAAGAGGAGCSGRRSLSAEEVSNRNFLRRETVEAAANGGMQEKMALVHELLHDELSLREPNDRTRAGSLPSPRMGGEWKEDGLDGMRDNRDSRGHSEGSEGSELTTSSFNLGDKAVDVGPAHPPGGGEPERVQKVRSVGFAAGSKRTSGRAEPLVDLVGGAGGGGGCAAGSSKDTLSTPLL